MSAYAKLSRQHRRFVDMVLKVGCRTEAYRKLHPKAKRPDQGAWKLFLVPQIRAAIEERDAEAMHSAGITRTRTWTEVRRVAFFDHRRLLAEDGSPLPLHKVDEDTVAAIAGIEIEEIYEGAGEERVYVGDLKKYKTWNKNEALKLILQKYGELLERHEHAGPNGGPIPVKDAGELSELDLARRVAFVLARGLRASQAAESTSNPAIPPGDSTST